jgi:hypothetical protein
MNEGRYDPRDRTAVSRGGDSQTKTCPVCGMDQETRGGSTGGSVIGIDGTLTEEEA